MSIASTVTLKSNGESGGKVNGISCDSTLSPELALIRDRILKGETNFVIAEPCMKEFSEGITSLLQKPIGCTLIEKLIEGGGIITVSYGKSSGASPQPGRGPRRYQVVLQNERERLLCRDKNGELFFQEVPYAIRLAHELIHIRHYQKDIKTNSVPAASESFTDAEEELAITGRAKVPSPNPQDYTRLLFIDAVNENSLRKEYGIAPRASHIGSYYSAIPQAMLPEEYQLRMLEAVTVGALGELRRLVEWAQGNGFNPAPIHSGHMFHYLLRAVQKGFADVTAYLLAQRADAALFDDQGSLAIHHAVSFNQPDVLITLIDGKSSIDAQDNFRRTPLMLAASKSHVRCLRILCANRANLELYNSVGNRALHLAVNKGSARCVMHLLQAGADPSGLAWNDKTTPLHHALDPACAKLLLAAPGVKIEARAANGCTPLHIATIKGRAEIVKLLLHHTANAYAGIHGEIPYALAIRHWPERVREIIPLLLNAKRNVPRKELVAVGLKEVEAPVVAENKRVGCVHGKVGGD